MSESILIPQKKRTPIVQILSSKKPYKVSELGYRDLVVKHYDGFAGWFTLVSGFLTGHESLAKRIINRNSFNIRGCKKILDAGCGNGRYLKTIAAQADSDAMVVGIDFSGGMLRRAKKRLKSGMISLLSADLKRLPFEDHSFDAVVCGWVLEHFFDPSTGLRELARVVSTEGKVLLFTTEDTIAGAICSRLYHCKTYNREELKSLCASCGLQWHKEYWWSSFHRRLKLSGIIVELRPICSSSVSPRQL